MITELIGGGLKMLSGRSDLENPQQWFIDWANGGSGAATSSGEHITPENALRVTPVYAAVSVLAESIQTLPIEIMRKEKSGTKSTASDHPVQELFFREVNDEMSTPVWKNASQIHLGTYGNTYSQIGRSRGEIPISLNLLSPKLSRTKQVRGKDGKLHYELRDENGQQVGMVPAKDMFHIPYFSINGLTGQSPILLLKEAVGGNKAAERYTNELFKNGGTPQGHYTMPGEMSETAHARLKRDLAEQAEHGNRHMTPILEADMKFMAAGLKPEEVQMTIARNFLIEEICRIYRITPHLLQQLANSGVSNVAELGREFITYTMMPWMNLWAGEINRKLLKPPFFARFNATEFLRGDPKELAEWLKAMFMIGVFSDNEIRSDLGYDKLDDPNADEHFVPLNMVPLSKATDPDWVKRGSGGVNNEENPGGVPGGDGVTPGDATMKPTANSGDNISKELDEVLAINKIAIECDFRRMSRIEANAAKRAAKHPDTFIASLEKFWPLHRDRLIDAISLSFRTHAAIQGYVCDNKVGELSVDDEISLSADEQIKHHHSELMTAAECKPSELADRVAAVVEKWTTNNQSNDQEVP